MKILVYLNQMSVGGAETNSIELCSVLRETYGHQITFFAPPGPMAEIAKQRGLGYIPAPSVELNPARRHPSLARIRALRDAVRLEKPDLLQVWDTGPCVDAFFGVRLQKRLPIHQISSTTVVCRAIPKRTPQTYMQRDLDRDARSLGRHCTNVLYASVDTSRNAPDVVDVEPFRTEYRVRSDQINLVTVSRLENRVKGESLHRTIAAVEEIGGALPLRLLLVGDGNARSSLEDKAAAVNERLGREAITFTGTMIDPRPAYASADIVIGMGTSAMRGLAFAKPVVVVGGSGFVKTVSPDSAEYFLDSGMYGRGGGGEDNSELIRSIVYLANMSIAERAEFGRFSREFAEKHFDLKLLSKQLDQISRETVSNQPGFALDMLDAARIAAIIAGNSVLFKRGRQLISRRFPKL